jgi:hypothetical protein
MFQLKLDAIIRPIEIVTTVYFLSIYFSGLVHNGPGVYLASYTMGTSWSFLGVKLLGHGVNHLPASNTDLKERLEMYLYLLSVPLWQVVGLSLHLPFSWPDDDLLI